MSRFSRKAVPAASLVVVRTESRAHRIIAPGKPSAVRAALRKAATTRGAVLEMSSMDSPNKVIRIPGAEILDFTVAPYDGPRP